MPVERSLRRKQRRNKRILFWTIVPIVILLASASLFTLYLTNKMATAAEDSHEQLERGVKSEKRIEAVDPGKDHISILFLGIDDSEARGFGGATRSDAMILATFNETEKSIKMVSIPRDSYVYLPDRDKKDKITHAHAFDGIDGAVSTVEELFDIPVDYYVRMNFDAFIEVIDSLDGVKVDVPFTFTEQDSEDRANAIRLKKGVHTLNGEEALAFVRMRKLDNDIERGKRQQQVLEAIIKKAVSFGSITKYGDVIDAIGDNMTTNISFGEIIALHDYAAAGSNLSVESSTLPGVPDIRNGGWYYFVEEEGLTSIKTELQTHLGLLDDANKAAPNQSALEDHQESE